MKGLNKKLLTAALLGMAALAPAAADEATTTGGLKIRTDDGKFEFQIGGRIQVDSVIFDDDKLAERGVFSSSSGVYVRRSYLTITGKLYGWDYKFENDFSSGASPGSFRDLYIAHEVLGGNLQIGQRKPFRSLQELESDLDTLFLERTFLNLAVFSPTGQRTYQPGIFYAHPVADGVLATSVYNANHGLGTNAGQGFGTSERFTYPVYKSENVLVHLGAWGGVESFSKNPPGSETVAYAGRNSGNQVVGPTQVFASAANGSDQTFYGVEAAVQAKSFFVQGEYARSTYGDARGEGKNDDVETYYVEAGYFLTGEKRVYRPKTGIFGIEKPKHGYGAFELVARYDSIENEDEDASAGTGVCQAAAAVVRTGAACSAKQYSGGVNWYANQAVAVKADYAQGDNRVTGDHTGSYNLRLQLAF